MLAAVPACIAGRITQPEVGAQIDDTARERTKLVDARHRLPVRQAEKQHVAWLEVSSGGELQLRRRAKIRMRVVHELPGQSLRRHLAQLHIAMEQKQPQQLAAGVRTPPQSRPGSPVALSRALHRAVRIHQLVPVPSVNRDAFPADTSTIVAGTSKAQNTTPFRNCVVGASAESVHSHGRRRENPRTPLRCPPAGRGSPATADKMRAPASFQPACASVRTIRLEKKRCRPMSEVDAVAHASAG